MITQLVDGNTLSIYAYNDSAVLVEVPANALLGTLETLDWNKLQPVEHSRWTEAKLDISSTYNFDAPKTGINTNSFASSLIQPEATLRSTGHFGTTIYGNTATTQRLNNTIGQFEKLFTDDGSVANIPEEDWMQIPLADD